MKKLTPDLYEKINLYSNTILYFKVVLGKGHYKDIDNIPRPSTLFMKDYFKNEKIKGCEIGVWKGKNSLSLLSELNIEILYLVDIWKDYDGYTDIKKNQELNYLKILEKFGNDLRIKILKGFSNKMYKNIINNSLDFVYIDGNHSYNYVMDDLNLYYPKVKTNGVICGHNIMNPETYSAVLTWSKAHNYVPLIIPQDFIIVKR